MGKLHNNNNKESSFKDVNDRIEDDEDFLTLSLSPKPIPSTVAPFQDHVFPVASKKPVSTPLLSPPHEDSHDLTDLPTSQQSTRRRKSPTNNLKPGKSPNVPAPYPWATTRRATVHGLQFLLSNGMSKISGQVKCKRCDRQYEIEYDLQEKFVEVAKFISENKSSMHERAPAVWMNPTLPNCKFCEQSNCLKPTPSKKRSINWLFLLLGQMLGCCKLAELKYFCKHRKNHRTGAKDRVLYLTYLELCKQLKPDGPFAR